MKKLRPASHSSWRQPRSSHQNSERVEKLFSLRRHRTALRHAVHYLIESISGDVNRAEKDHAFSFDSDRPSGMTVQSHHLVGSDRSLQALKLTFNHIFQSGTYIQLGLIVGVSDQEESSPLIAFYQKSMKGGGSITRTYVLTLLLGRIRQGNGKSTVFTRELCRRVILSGVCGA